MLLSAILGYLLRYWTKKPDTNTILDTANQSYSSATHNEWENKYKAAIGSHEKSINEFKIKIQSAEDRTLSFKSQVEEWKSKLSHTESTISDWEQKYLGIKNDLEKTRLKLDSSLAENIKLQTELTNSKALTTEASLNLSSSIKDTFNEKIIGMQRDIDKLNMDNSNLSTRLDASNSRVIELLSKETLANELRIINEKLRNENESLKSNTTSNPTSDLTSYIDEINSLKNKLAEMETDRHRQAENLNELRHEISAERKQYQVEIAALESRLADSSSKTAPIDKNESAPMNTNAISNINVNDNLDIKTDDIQVIEGIGPKVKELFHGQGITTWKAIADKSPEQLREFLAKGGDRYRIINPNSWPKQAQLLVEGNWIEFNKYTDYLIAGVDPSEVKESVPRDRSIPKGIKLDDLKIIEGIGPVIEGVLHKAGIKTWETLSNTSPRKLKSIILAEDERKFRMHDTATWAEQAAMADADQWDELKKYQDSLKGGRKVV